MEITPENALCQTLLTWHSSLVAPYKITREVEVEWMLYCMAILCNLARISKSVCGRIKQSSSYKAFSRRVIKLLSHDSRIVVVSSLVHVGYLEEKVRDMVYCPQSIHETFQCVFNVLIMGDNLLCSCHNINRQRSENYSFLQTLYSTNSGAACCTRLSLRRNCIGLRHFVSYLLTPTTLFSSVLYNSTIRTGVVCEELYFSMCDTILQSLTYCFT